MPKYTLLVVVTGQQWVDYVKNLYALLGQSKGNAAAQKAYTDELERVWALRKSYGVAVEGDPEYQEAVRLQQAKEADLHALERAETAVGAGHALITAALMYTLVRSAPDLLKAIAGATLTIYKEGAPGNSAVLG